MAGKNTVSIIGNVGAQPEIRLTNNGLEVTTMNVATNEKYKQNTHTEWHRVVLWGKQAEVAAKYCTKGKQVSVDGRLRTRKWTDKNGVERYTTEIHCASLGLL